MDRKSGGIFNAFFYWILWNCERICGKIISYIIFFYEIKKWIAISSMRRQHEEKTTKV